jgi:hypothetical protein
MLHHILLEHHLREDKTDGTGTTYRPHGKCIRTFAIVLRHRFGDADIDGKTTLK